MVRKEGLVPLESDLRGSCYNSPEDILEETKNPDGWEIVLK